MGVKRALGASRLTPVAVFISTCLLFMPAKGAAQSTSACLQSGTGTWHSSRANSVVGGTGRKPRQQDLQAIIESAWSWMPEQVTLLK